MSPETWGKLFAFSALHSKARDSPISKAHFWLLLLQLLFGKDATSGEGTFGERKNVLRAMFRWVPILDIPVHPPNNLAVHASVLEQPGQLDSLFQRAFRTGFSPSFYDEVRCLCVPLPGKAMMFFHHHEAKANIIGKVSERECREGST